MISNTRSRMENIAAVLYCHLRPAGLMEGESACQWLAAVVLVDVSTPIKPCLKR